MKYSQEEIQSAIKVVTSTISKCQKMQPKFIEGSSQYSLMKNRIKALQISKCLLDNDGSILEYSKEELEEALTPVISIINKTEKAQSKYEEGSTQYKRFSPLIAAMHIAKSLIADEIGKRE